VNGRPNTDTGCLLVGDYLDEGEVPEQLASLRDRPTDRVRVDRPRLVADYLDRWGDEGAAKEFTVLLRDNRVVTVRGDAVTHVQNASNPADYGSYGIVIHSGERERLVALFPVTEVTGVFSGTVRVAAEGT
jgi:hypothetical protein